MGTACSKHLPLGNAAPTVTHCHHAGGAGSRTPGADGARLVLHSGCVCSEQGYLAIQRGGVHPQGALGKDAPREVLGGGGTDAARRARALPASQAEPS